MQIFALDQNGLPISCLKASKGSNYACMECFQIVRLRGGNRRHLHFYHLASSSACRLNGKSEVHLKLQLFLQQLLPQGAALEKRVPGTNRIADVFWEEKKMIFEIQCSSISAEEAAARTRDYSSAGYQVVWILHESVFNRRAITDAEKQMTCQPHYFTNFTRRGVGIIYDQYSTTSPDGKRIRTPPFPVCLFSPALTGTHIFKQFSGHLSQCLEIREKFWKLSFDGDLYDRSHSETLALAFSRLEQRFSSKKHKARVRDLYLTQFYRILKKRCS